MGMTIVEKILAAHCDRGTVEPGDLIYADLDLILANDVTAPIGIKEFEKAGGKKVFDKDKIALVPDHFTPNKDIPSAEQCKTLREFARKHNITNYFEIGEVGIEHALLPDKGLVLPGDAVIGADSHTCTYGAIGAFSTGVGSTDFAAALITGQAWFKVPETIKFIYNGKLKEWVGGKDIILFTIGQMGVDGARYMSMEFTGEVIDHLEMAGRFTMCNMAIEAGAKCGIVAPDDNTIEYVRQRAQREYTIYKSDPDAHYADIKEWDVSDLDCQVACPHLPENAKPVTELADVKIDQALIGSCTNGRIEDLRLAAKILKGRKVAKGIRCIVGPATQEIYLAALKEGLLEIFVNAGAVISPPTCGACLGGHMGILAESEVAIATTNRNFIGRMGHKGSFVYLSNPAVAAASAITGRITHPDEIT